MAYAAWDGNAADDAAARAENDLVERNIPEEHITAIADWWSTWYTKTPDGKQGCGHKRLARVLLQYRTGAKQ